MEDTLPASPHDSELVEAARAGSEAAFERLVERHHGMVHLVAYSRVGHRETAEDLAQEAFLRAYLYIGHLDQPGAFAPWIARITRNLAETWLRKGQRRSELVTMVPLSDAALQEVPDERSRGGLDLMAEREETTALQSAIFQLPPDQRELVLLHYAEGLSKTEIASRLGLHPSTVGRQIEKAVDSLRGTLVPFLRRALSSFGTTSASSARTAALIGTAAVMSAQSKTSLAAAAGGSAWIASLPQASSVTGGVVASTLSLLKTIFSPLARTLPALGSGGTFVGIGKTTVVVTIGIGLVAGGIYIHQTRAANTGAAGAPVLQTTTILAPNNQPATLLQTRIYTLQESNAKQIKDAVHQKFYSNGGVAGAKVFLQGNTLILKDTPDRLREVEGFLISLPKNGGELPAK